MRRRKFLLAGAAGAAVASADSIVPRMESRRPFRQAGAAWFTNVAVQTQHGRTVRFYKDLLQGKVVLINFVFTACSDICPGVTQNLSDVQQRLGSRVGRDIFMYSITLTPEHDTPQTLDAYAETFGAGPGWLFLTGDPANIELLRHSLGFADSNPLRDADRTQHAGALRIGNEPLHRWTMCPALANPDSIVRSVLRVLSPTPHPLPPEPSPSI